MLRNSASAQPDLPSQRQRRGSSYQNLEHDHGYEPSRQHERNSSITVNPDHPLDLGSPTATPRRCENVFNGPKPSLLPYQEYHSGFTDADLASSPTASPSYSHRRQTSFSALLPLAIRNRTPSPTRKTSSFVPITEEMPYTGDARQRPSRPGTATSESSPQRGGFAGWLSGTAAGNALESLSQDFENLTPTKLRKPLPDIAATPTETVSARASRFMSALSTRLAPPSSIQHVPVANDELYNLDISTALFPPGSPSDRDAFSPSAFKNLQTTSLGLLSKFQAAYRAKVIALRDIEAERSAQRDELEEAVTRAAHLKIQLEGMARRAAEQEGAMKQLMDELMAEKRAREEDRLARMQRGVVAESLVSEDLGVEEEWRERKRTSGGSGESWAESTTTDEESVDESVFSRNRSPTRSAVQEDGGTVKGSGSGSGTVRIKGVNALQKMFKEFVGETDEVERCGNCQGRDASAAWDTVSMLRDENRHLKQRVGQLEVAVEGALDMVNGLGL